MSATSGKMFSVGLRYAAVFPLDTSGSPICTGAISSGSVAATTGYLFSGEKAFELAVPEPRRIVHSGEDRVQSVDFLPPTDSVTATLNTSANDYTLNAMLQGVSVATVGESKALPYQTDLQGYEPTVSLLCYQQAQDSATKQRRWRVVSLAASKCFPLPPGENDNPAEFKYSIAVIPSTKTIWGETLSSGSYGCTEAAFLEQMCEGKPALECFSGSASNPTFLVLSATPKADAKVAVYKNGTKLTVTSEYTLSANIVILVTPITATDYVWVFYET